MRSQASSKRAKRPVVPVDPNGLNARMGKLLVGQPEAIETIIPYIQMHQAGLAPDGRPIGVVLLLGPTGTGKTRTVEALADVLHGTGKSLLRIDCGEFQMDHEIAKLVGSPPGYLGHRETEPMLNQATVKGVASEASAISLILFDEIEKAAPSMTRLLLGILDKATLRLGDNKTVNFENALIFLTSNLGAKSMLRASAPEFGFEALLPPPASVDSHKLHSIAMGAVKRKFSPEFVNRIDSVITYKPLTRAEYELILDQILANYGDLIRNRLGAQSFELKCTKAGRELLLDTGVSVEFGARELKRAVHRNFIQPVAALVAQGRVLPGSTFVLGAKNRELSVVLAPAIA